jgi:hypothetical protein
MNSLRDTLITDSAKIAQLTLPPGITSAVDDSLQTLWLAVGPGDVDLGSAATLER